MSVPAFAFASLAGIAAWAGARALMEWATFAAAFDRLASAARDTAGNIRGVAPVGLALQALYAAGRFQVRLAAIERFAGVLHRKTGEMLGERNPGAPAFLAVREAAGLAAGAFLWWLAGDPFTGLAGFLAGAAAPDFVVRGLHEARQARIRRELPDFLDMMALSLEAGLGLDAAFQRSAEMLGEGLLPGEVARMQGEVRFGMRRHEAWKGMARRLGNAEVGEVMGALVQADSMGVGLAGALKSLAEHMRQRQRQRAEEAAHKAPVRLLFPLAFFIFPAIFIVLLGPVALQFLEVVG